MELNGLQKIMLTDFIDPVIININIFLRRAWMR